MIPLQNLGPLLKVEFVHSILLANIPQTTRINSKGYVVCISIPWKSTKPPFSNRLVSKPPFLTIQVRVKKASKRFGRPPFLQMVLGLPAFFIAQADPVSTFLSSSYYPFLKKISGGSFFVSGEKKIRRNVPSAQTKKLLDDRHEPNNIGVRYIYLHLACLQEYCRLMYTLHG